MGVSFHNPWVLILGAILTAAVCLTAFFLKRKSDRTARLKAANTARLKNTAIYKRKLLEAKIFRLLSYSGIIIALIGATILTARPYKRDVIKDTVNRRDIFLCIDISSSNYAGVEELVGAFKETVSGLDGDRIGISLFNTSSIQYVPMTDDYDFVLRRLEALETYLAAQQEFMTTYASKYESVYDIPEAERPRYEELNRILATFDSGVTAGYELKGTSAIGEGLASCLFSFPELTQEERTRIIIFLTDNQPELLDVPLVTLDEAAKMCQFDKVIVFGIDPAVGQDPAQYSANINEMKDAVELTGGKFYGPDTTLTAADILADIQSIENRITKTTTSTRDTDTPTLWFVVLTAGIVLIALTTLYFVFRRGLKRGRPARLALAGIMLAAMIAGAVYIAVRPMYQDPSKITKTTNLDVAFVVDTTISMWAEDHGNVKRMDGVRRDIQTIMDALPGSCFSLISFDNGANILAPYTQDINVISDLVAHLEMPSYTTSQGSSLNTAYEALRIMLEASGKKKGNRKTVVFLFSDGETTDGSSLMSFKDLEKLVGNGGVLGYGTQHGGRMYYPGRGYIQNVSTGKDALSKIDETTLRSIANDLGITYINETNDQGGSLIARLQSVRLMSRDAAFADGDRTGFEETYYYSSAILAVVLLIWLFLTIYRGGVA